MKTFRFISIFLTSFALLVSCEDFLDKSPDMGLDENDIYRDFSTMRGFMDKAYDYLENFHSFESYYNSRTYLDAISDELASICNFSRAIPVNSGNWLSNEIKMMEIGVNSVQDQGSTTIWKSYRGLRIVNRVISDIDKVMNLSESERSQLLGQAYFLRAWFYFQLITRYGGMPKFDKLFVGDGDEDLPRMTYHQSHEWMMSDIENAILMLPDTWNDANTGRPTRIAALALKAKAQLYDASPLMQNGLDKTEVMSYDKERAKIAAKSADYLIQYLESHPELGYGLLPKEKYSNNFYWNAPPYTQPEFLWYNRKSFDQPANYIRALWLPAEYAKGTGNVAVVYNAPTQNMVDMYEKKGEDGKFYPISDPNAGYNPQNPFVDRDPRFYNNILCPGEKWGENKSGKPQYITTYVDGQSYKTVLNNQATNQRQQTGYVCKKFIWEGADQWKELYKTNRVITTYIRLSEIYLDLAEASFEATGSAEAKVDGCKYSALDALNVIRNRIGIGELPDSYVTDPDLFREAYRRERCVELMFENQRWFDLRRWMTAHEVFAPQYPIRGLRAIPKDKNHNKVQDKSTLEFTYEYIDIIPEIRVFDMKHYWYPFSSKDVASLNNLKQNPGW